VSATRHMNVIVETINVNPTALASSPNSSQHQGMSYRSTGGATERDPDADEPEPGPGSKGAAT
jgi:hypothetical protein